MYFKRSFLFTVTDVDDVMTFVLKLFLSCLLNLNILLLQNGTRVPVIIPKEVIPAMEYLANPVTRLNSGIKEENPFLFANSGK